MSPNAASTQSSNSTLNGPHTISISGGGVSTLASGPLVRLSAGDQATIEILVSGVQDDATVTVELQDEAGLTILSEDVEASALIEEWTSDEELLVKHETPGWVSQGVNSLEFGFPF